MENINTVVAENLQYYRQAHRLSLDKIAQLTGISKTMISQIEKGVANPSINTLWKIANGLRIPLTSLISEENEAIQKIDRSDIQPIYNDNRSVVVFRTFHMRRHMRLKCFVCVWMRTVYLNQMHIKKARKNTLL